MSETSPTEVGETPTVEVRVYEHEELIRTELCETVEEAAAMRASWEETPGVVCEIVDLSAPTDESLLEVGGPDVEAGYPHTGGATDQS